MNSLGIVDTKKMIAVINDVFKVDFKDYSLTTLRNRFNVALKHFNIGLVDDFVTQVKNNNINFEQFVDQMMVDTTEMFRDPKLWRDIRETYLPEICKSPGVKIWLAGVPSGDELFSLMILLEEANLPNKPRIYVSCPSKIRVKRIKEGWGYDLKKMELGEANYKRFSGKKEFSSYYTVKDNKAFMNTDLLKGVEFNNKNISQERDTSAFRMVMLRNIMNQYNMPLQERVIGFLHKSVTMGGYLIIGSKETLEYSEVGKKFVLVNDEEKVYKKRVD